MSKKIVEEWYNEYDGEFHYSLTPFGKLVVAVILTFVLFCFFQMGLQDKQKENSAKTSSEAIKIADTIEFNKEYSDKTIKNDKDKIHYKTYKFSVTEPGQIGVEYKCKKSLISRAHIVMWEMINLDTGEKILESHYHSFDIDMIDVEPGNYAIQFHSISNEISLDLRKRPFTFTVHFDASK